MEQEIIILGTGNAGAIHCYNTCFVLRCGDDHLLVDAGGGNGILRQLPAAGVSLDSIDTMFITHAHTDHILGAVWIARMILQYGHARPFRVYGNSKVLHVLEFLIMQLLPKKQSSKLGDALLLCPVEDGDTFQAGHLSLTCFDIHSTKEWQFGFSTTLPDGQRFTCLGDEPYNEINEPFARNADWLMSEAFCLYADRERFKPYEKHHSTALDAARLASQLGVKNLILYHTEDKTLATRKEKYTAEAQSAFSGRVFVPNDLEHITLV
jgi:ribonuclease Z